MAEAIKGESDSYVQSSSGRTRKRGHFGTFRAFPVLISGVGRLIAFVDNQVVAGPTIENIKPTINFKPSVLDNRSIVARKDYIYIYTRWFVSPFQEHGQAFCRPAFQALAFERGARKAGLARMHSQGFNSQRPLRGHGAGVACQSSISAVLWTL